MNLLTITQISKNFNISTRTLRYYEQMGLLQSVKKDDYAYRTYDDAAVLRLQQIVVLRKLRIPLKQIITILESENASEIIEAFRRNLNDVDDEITALSTIRTILNAFISRLNENTNLDIKVGLLDDISILDVVDSLTVTKIAFKEEKTMKDLSRASETLDRIEDKDVRIIYLPPSAIASIYCLSDDAESDSDKIMGKFVEDAELFKMNRGLRFYGFNNPVFEGEKFIKQGYEVWATTGYRLCQRRLSLHKGCYLCFLGIGQRLPDDWINIPPILIQIQYVLLVQDCTQILSIYKRFGLLLPQKFDCLNAPL